MLPIAAWSAWAPGLESLSAWTAWAATKTVPSGDGSPAIPFVDSLMRRRLSRFARMALHVAHDCAGNKTVDRTVFASRHGELQRTAAMLHDLGRANGVSPTDFSLSVHNAVAGVHSIVAKNRSPSVAIAAGEESFAYGLLEAAAQWQLNKNRSVLFVYADEPAPPEYRAFVSDNEYPHAVALLLASGAETSVRLARQPDAAPGASAETQPLAFLRAWLSRLPQASWRGAGSTWRWSTTANVG